MNYRNRNREKIKEKYQLKKALQDDFIRHKVTNTELKIIEDNRKALAEGMTYGQYMARRY